MVSLHYSPLQIGGTWLGYLPGLDHPSPYPRVQEKDDEYSTPRNPSNEMEGNPVKEKDVLPL